MELVCHRCGAVVASEAPTGRCPHCGYDFHTPFAKLRLAAASRLPKYWHAGWQTLQLMVFGAAAFWLPDTIWHIVRGPNFGGRDVLALTALMPLTLWAAFLLIKKLYRGSQEEMIGLPMMLGVWMLGGLFIGFGGLLSGGYADRADGFQSFLYVALIGLVAPLTYILATYDGSLGGLLLATFGSVVIAVRASRKRRHPN